MRELASKGHALYTAMFAAAESRRFRMALGDQGGMTVELGEDTILIPWEFLYPEFPGPDVPVTPGGFLGSRVLFVRQTVPDEGVASPTCEGEPDPSDPFACLPTEPVAAGARPRIMVGHVIDDRLPTNKLGKERSWRHGVRKRIKVRELEPLDAACMSTDEMRTRLASFMQDAHDIVHFDCHVGPRGDEPYRPLEFFMRIRNDHEAVAADFKAWRLHPCGDVLVVLNCCDADASVHWDRDSIARTVHRRGSRSVISASAQVNDTFALQFAAELYHWLVRPLPVGEALLATRAALLERTGNPAALLYTLHGAATHTLRVAA